MHRWTRISSALLWLLFACKDNTVIVGKLPDSASHHDAGQDASARNSAGTDARASQPSDAAQSDEPAQLGPRADSTAYDVAIESSSYSEVCSGRGSLLVSTRSDGTTAACEARVERRLFGYGLCACEELRFTSESFLIDSFDSSVGMYSPGQTGGNAAVSSARLELAKTTEIRGSLTVAGDGLLTLAAPSFVVSGDLESNAALQVTAGTARIARDLWAASDVLASPGQGSLRVERDAYQPSGRVGIDSLSVGGTRYTSEFRVPEPCRCGAAAPIDVAALVAEARERNDNAAAGFDPNTLVIGSFVTNALAPPCGRLFAPSFSLAGDSTFTWLVSERTALFVAGDLTVGPIATLMISPWLGGELDLFVAGKIVVSAGSTLALGVAARPAATRVFVAGAIESPGNLAISAQLYAPNAEVATQESLAEGDQFGAIYARSIKLAAKRFHYDRAILSEGPACATAQPIACGSCYECPDGLACRAGSCERCMSDADCCDPAVCAEGRCQPLVSTWP